MHVQWGRICLRGIPIRISNSWSLVDLQLRCWNDRSSVPLHPPSDFSPKQTSGSIHVVHFFRWLRSWSRYGDSEYGVCFRFPPLFGSKTDCYSGHTKKVTTNALIFIAFCVSNIIARHFSRPIKRYSIRWEWGPFWRRMDSQSS
jgi:hypothetical protein